MGSCCPPALGNFPDITGDGVREEVMEEMFLIGFQDSGVESRDPRAGEMEPWEEIMGGAVDNISNLSEMSESPRQFPARPDPTEVWEKELLGKPENWAVAELEKSSLERLPELEKRLEDSVVSEKGLARAPAELWLNIWEGNLIGVFTSV